MTARTIALLCLLFCALPCCTRAGNATQHAIEMGGIERTYTLFIPACVSKDKPAALVILFHGSGGNGMSMDHMSGFSAVAEREGFILSSPCPMPWGGTGTMAVRWHRFLRWPGMWMMSRLSMP